MTLYFFVFNQCLPSEMFYSLSRKKERYIGAPFFIKIRLLEEKKISIERLAIVRDIFLFSCYTGFAYIDAASLARDHLKTGTDGKKWLIKSRQKTGISERVPLIPPAIQILDKYKNHPVSKTRNRLLPVPSNQKVNASLKELADICGINVNLTFHIARHTFATTVALENGVPLDSVSKMLGHRSIKTTQIYARVSDKKSAMTQRRFSKNILNDFIVYRKPLCLDE